MNLERFSTKFVLLVTHKTRIRCKRLPDTSQIRKVMNPESKVQNLYVILFAGVHESTLETISERPEQETNLRPSYYQFGCFSIEL